MLNLEFDTEIQSLAFLGIAFVYMWIAKIIFDFRASTRFDADHEIEEESNLAVGLPSTMTRSLKSPLLAVATIL